MVLTQMFCSRAYDYYTIHSSQVSSFMVVDEGLPTQISIFRMLCWGETCNTIAEFPEGLDSNPNAQTCVGRHVLTTSTIAYAFRTLYMLTLQSQTTVPISSHAVTGVHSILMKDEQCVTLHVKTCTHTF